MRFAMGMKYQPTLIAGVSGSARGLKERALEATRYNQGPKKAAVIAKTARAMYPS